MPNLSRVIACQLSPVALFFLQFHEFDRKDLIYLDVSMFWTHFHWHLMFYLRNSYALATNHWKPLKNNGFRWQSSQNVELSPKSNIFYQNHETISKKLKKHMFWYHPCASSTARLCSPVPTKRNKWRDFLCLFQQRICLDNWITLRY